MPQIAPFVVELEDTPDATHMLVLEPTGPSTNNVVAYTGGRVSQDKTTHVTSGPPTVTALQSTVTVSISRPSKTSRISKVRVKLVVPVAALDLEGKPTSVKSHENSADVTFLLAEKSSETERQQLESEFRSMLSDGPFPDVIRRLKGMY